MAYFSRTMAKITPENFSSERIKSITVRVCITNCTGAVSYTHLTLPTT